MVEPISTAIAALALIVSALAVIYTRRQARAAQVQADELRELQHERKRPRIEVSAEPIGVEIRLAVTNAGFDPVDSVEVELSAVKNDGTQTARTRALADTAVMEKWASRTIPGCTDVREPCRTRWRADCGLYYASKARESALGMVRRGTRSS